jgi:glyoxylase-like metal-dependent hydrolase (beta-lactamase superfamily II)
MSARPADETRFPHERQAERLTRVELARGIVAVGDESRGWVRAFLVADGKDLTLVDTLADVHPFQILAAIRRMGRSLSDLKRIWLTHAHFSHLCGAAAMRELSGAKVCSHPFEADIVSGDRKAQRVSIVPKRPFRAYIPFQLGLALGLGDHPPCPVDDTLAEGQEEGGLAVLHTPGHTPGHLAFWSEKHKVLLSGDAIVTWPELAAGWDSFTLNERQRQESLRRMAALAPEKVGVGHGDPIVERASERVNSLLRA